MVNLMADLKRWVRSPSYLEADRVAEGLTRLPDPWGQGQPPF